MKRKDLEQQAIEWVVQAHKNCMDAHSVLRNQFSPVGSGALTKESMDIMDSAEAELCAAQANMTRLAQAL